MKFLLLISILITQGPLAATETGSIAGMVRQLDGKPALGVRVAAMVVPDGLGGGNSSTLAAITQTDSSGRYRLENVPPGRYYIVAGRVDVPTYYPGASAITGATSISVTPGAMISEIDFMVSHESTRPAPSLGLPRGLSPSVLLFSPPVRVTGRIVMEDRAKDAKVPERVLLNTRSNTATVAGLLSIPRVSVLSSRLAIAPDGTFAIDLPAGEASISVGGLPQGYSIQSMTSGSTDLGRRSINIQAGMPEIVIVLTADTRPRFRVGGRVLDGATGRPLLGEHIELVDEAGSTIRLIIDAEGRFEFTRVLTGNYILRLATAGRMAEQRIAVINDVVSYELRTGTP
jgi:hypothetical protein